MAALATALLARTWSAKRVRSQVFTHSQKNAPGEQC